MQLSALDRDICLQVLTIFSLCSQLALSARLKPHVRLAKGPSFDSQFAVKSEPREGLRFFPQGEKEHKV